MNRLRDLLWILLLTTCLLTVRGKTLHADLIGYWSADSTAGAGGTLPNDQGASELDGELFGGAEYSASGAGHTGQAGDYALSFPGFDEDYAVIPATDLTFEEITVTAWVKGIQNGDWAGIVLSRDALQPIGLDFHAFDGQLNYIWNDNSASTWGFVSGLFVPEDEWAFVALTVTSDAATLWVGPQGESLDFAMNEMEHFPQDNLTEWRLAEDDCCFPQVRNFSGLIDDVSIWNHALSEEDLMQLHSGAATPLTLAGGATPGDFNNDGQLDALDIELLSSEVRAGTNMAAFDVTSDGLVNESDRQHWVSTLRKTWFGDANMDGQFDSADLVEVLGIGEYEDGVDNNSTWAEGDWDGNANFSSGDFVTALADGGYEAGPRPAIAAVPEPSCLTATLLAMFALCLSRRSAIAAHLRRMA
jgi:hypothetical protein